MAAAFAWQLPGQPVGLVQVAGGTIVLAGIGLAIRAERPRGA